MQSSRIRARSMMRVKRPAPVPIIPDTAVSKKTGATAN